MCFCLVIKSIDRNFVGNECMVSCVSQWIRVKRRYAMVRGNGSVSRVLS